VETEAKIGVFICDCGTEIAGFIDTEALVDRVRDVPHVTLVQRGLYNCSKEGQKRIKQAIAEQGLNRVVVAGCTPRTHKPLFWAVCEEAGLNGSLFEMANIREQCAWVHADERERTTAKALDLIRMAVAKAALLEIVDKLEAKVTPAALVIGAGTAGLTAALTLAHGGFPVKLVERERELGGLVRKLHTLYPTMQRAEEFISEKVKAVQSNPNIEVLTKTRILDIGGSAGNYHVSVGGNGHEAAFDVGAIIVATGAQPSHPDGLLRYDGRRVITQFELEGRLKAGPLSALRLRPSTAPFDFAQDKLRTSSGQGPSSGSRQSPVDAQNIMMIHGAGSEEEQLSCSSVYCMAILKNAIFLKKMKPEANISILFRDLQTFGELCEDEIVGARQRGINFIHFGPESKPVVKDDVVEVYDLLSGADLSLPYDLVVLSTPLVASDGASTLASMLCIPLDDNGFFPDVHARLRPRNYVDPGIYVCGSAHYPADTNESLFQAYSAASKALHHLSAGVVTGEAPVAAVAERLCTGCGTCVETCAFQVISLERGEGVLSTAQIAPLLCKGCGNCVTACPSKAITLQSSTDRQFLAQISAALAGPQDGEPRVLGLLCQWSGYAAADLAGARHLQYPSSVRLIQAGCSARFDPHHILWAFLNGADGVFLGACEPGECHYILGNQYAESRIKGLRETLIAAGFDARRLQLAWLKPDEPEEFVTAITDFTASIEKLGPAV
jgi:heterodisulfide reductase subunit A